MDANLAASKENKKIFEPDNVERLLEGWLLHAYKGRERHDLAARQYDQTRIWLGGIAAVVSAIVATSASLSTTLADILTIKIIVAILSTLSAILVGLNTFLNLAERAEKHRSAGVRYKEIIRELQRILSNPSVKNLTGDDQSVMSIQKNTDNLEETAPVVSERIHKKIEDEWNTKGLEFVNVAKRLHE